jgi:hypothetical protein
MQPAVSPTISPLVYLEELYAEVRDNGADEEDSEHRGADTVVVRARLHNAEFITSKKSGRMVSFTNKDWMSD